MPSAYEGTDIISYFHGVKIYHTAKPYIMLQKQYIIENATFNDIIDLKEGAFMSDNKLLDMSFEFAVAIVNLVDGVTAPKVII